MAMQRLKMRAEWYINYKNFYFRYKNVQNLII